MQIRKCTEQDVSSLARMNKHLIEDEKSNNPMNIDELEDRKQAFELLMNYLQADVIDIEVLPWNEQGRIFWKHCGFLLHTK